MLLLVMLERPMIGNITQDYSVGRMAILGVMSLARSASRAGRRAPARLQPGPDGRARARLLLYVATAAVLAASSHAAPGDAALRPRSPAVPAILAASGAYDCQAVPNEHWIYGQPA